MRWHGGGWQVHTASKAIPPPSVINAGKGHNVPKSFTAAVTLSLRLKRSIPTKMDRPLGGGRVLLYALMGCLNSVIKVRDLLQHFLKHFFKPWTTVRTMFHCSHTCYKTETKVLFTMHLDIFCSVFFYSVTWNQHWFCLNKQRILSCSFQSTVLEGFVGGQEVGQGSGAGWRGGNRRRVPHIIQASR